MAASSSSLSFHLCFPPVSPPSSDDFFDTRFSGPSSPLFLFLCLIPHALHSDWKQIVMNTESWSSKNSIDQIKTRDLIDRGLRLRLIVPEDRQGRLSTSASSSCGTPRIQPLGSSSSSSSSSFQESDYSNRWKGFLGEIDRWSGYSTIDWRIDSSYRSVLRRSTRRKTVFPVWNDLGDWRRFLRIYASVVVRAGWERQEDKGKVYKPKTEISNTIRDIYHINFFGPLFSTRK